MWHVIFTGKKHQEWRAVLEYENRGQQPFEHLETPVEVTPDISRGTWHE